MKAFRRILVSAIVVLFIATGISTASTLASRELPTHLVLPVPASPASPIYYPSAMGSHAAKLETPWFLQIRCIIIIIIFVQYDAALGGGTETITANGSATFNILQSSKNPFSQTLQIANLNLNGQSPAHGAFTTGIDVTQPTTLTTVNQNGPAGPFPATGDIFFHPTVTLASNPGVVYTAIQEQHLNTTNLRSYAPQNNERWNLVNQQVDFADPANPDQIAFSILTQQTTVN